MKHKTRTTRPSPRRKAVSLRRRATRPRARPPIELLGTGLIYRNPAPELRAIHAMHPTLVSLDSGELVSAFDLGQGPESFDYASYLSRSADGGRTWSPPVPIFRETHPRRCTHLLRVGRVPDGTLTAFGLRLFRDHDERGLVNPTNFGYTETEIILLISTDGGHAWDGPRTLEPPLVGPSWEVCHTIRELADGRWIAPLSTWKSWEGDAPNGMKAVALVSHDRGRTWAEYMDVFDDWANGVMHLEQSVVELPDRRLLAIAWAFHERSGKTRPTPYAVSRDARAFGKPKRTGLRGQTAKMLVLRDGRILTLYRRNDKPGLWANLSRLDGERWANLAEAPLWQGASSGMSGKSAAGVELSALKFGFPNLLLMPDGTVLAAFWCREDCITNIRWLRIAVH